MTHRDDEEPVMTTQQFDSDNRPSAIEPIFYAGAVFIVSVLLICALLLAAA